MSVQVVCCLSSEANSRLGIRDDIYTKLIQAGMDTMLDMGQNAALNGEVEYCDPLRQERRESILR